LKADECRVTYSAELVENHHVGNEWYTALYYNERTITTSSVISYADGLVFCAYVEEDDKHPDTKEVKVEFENLAPGQTATKTVSVVVREDGGQYKGNRAVWEFTITVTRGK
jgi:hypothetical protein